MHLLNVNTLRLETFFGAQIPEYAILSHTWGAHEVTFADIQNIQGPTTQTLRLAGFDKIRKTCVQAKADNYQYVWIDTCCIDKSSSAELTEAINSMFQWYKSSEVCYAYLSDVSTAEMRETFPRSRWFSRGWTLQELLAPGHVIFYDGEWHALGTKDDHATWIADITGIDVHILINHGISGIFSKNSLGEFCVAKRMSWASHRETTRMEDMAYRLLGLFGVNMPLLYGEGDRAFIRLQEEIIKSYDDDSILAWGLDTETWNSSGSVPESLGLWMRINPFLPNILASSPKDFKNCRILEYAEASKTPFMMTNLGLQIELPLVPMCFSDLSYIPPGWVGLLSCSAGTSSKFVGIALLPTSQDLESPIQVRRTRYGHYSGMCSGLVGPRAAAKAKRSQITIIQDNDYQNVRSQYPGFRHFIPNESPELLSSGYNVFHAFGKCFAGKEFGSWDSISKVLTMNFKRCDYDLICFQFKTDQDLPDSEFSIFFCHGSAIVRRGVLFSITEERNIVYPEEEDLPQHDEQNMTVKSRDGSEYSIVVTVTEKEVSFSIIIEIGVGLVPLNAV
jgi:hypothetical protein